MTIALPKTDPVPFMIQPRRGDFSNAVFQNLQNEMQINPSGVTQYPLALSDAASSL